MAKKKSSKRINLPQTGRTFRVTTVVRKAGPTLRGREYMLANIRVPQPTIWEEPGDEKSTMKGKRSNG